LQRSGHRAVVTGVGVKQQHVTNRRADRPALHPCRHGHLEAGAASLAMRGQQGTVIASRNPVGSKEQADKRHLRAVGQTEAMPIVQPRWISSELADVAPTSKHPAEGQGVR
jgi:hypothetical protein